MATALAVGRRRRRSLLHSVRLVCCRKMNIPRSVELDDIYVPLWAHAAIAMQFVCPNAYIGTLSGNFDAAFAIYMCPPAMDRKAPIVLGMEWGHSSPRGMA